MKFLKVNFQFSIELHLFFLKPNGIKHELLLIQEKIKINVEYQISKSSETFMVI